MKITDLDVLEWKPTVEIIASKFPAYHRDDLISEGMTGLCDAARRFKSSRGISFATYATHRIRGQMKDYLRQWRGKGRGRPTGRNKWVADIKVFSIDCQMSNEDGANLTIADTIGEDGMIDRFMEYDEVASAMDRCLTEREREYIRLRFEEGLYLREVGAAMGVSEAAACHVCKKAIRKIRVEVGV